MYCRSYLPRRCPLKQDVTLRRPKASITNASPPPSHIYQTAYYATRNIFGSRQYSSSSSSRGSDTHADGSSGSTATPGVAHTQSLTVPHVVASHASAAHLTTSAAPGETKSLSQHGERPRSRIRIQSAFAHSLCDPSTICFPGGRGV